MSQAVLEAGMAKKTTPVRIGDEALRLSRIASSYTGESVVDYITRVLSEHAQADIDRLHDEMKKGQSKPKRGS